MGRVTTEAAIENMEDLWAIKRGLLPADQARRVTIPDALVDTGATLLSLPTRVIQQLGLTRTVSKRVTSSIGLGEAGLQSGVPVLFGVLTCDTLEQAIHRSGGNVGNKGSECALAALEMVNLLTKIV